ncbi:hypothetical protein HMF8227_00823 [Saliniradius amylolyticus]|uniref:Lipoprotein LPP20-like domain-containing protein n=1 Tax=Saliniradius amylolyticus TaxID=2183582 RepID=A0A2S2E0Z5_9ALTE|nr:LPP20 family lipoprotein [Saliniradius amylolyticus]AWL11318.1 hypothetical protein HMF8227_00823 [Saliniradius amylolyticus]
MKQISLGVTLGLALLTGGCSSVFDRQVEWEYVEPDHYPVVKAVGYAPVSVQKGQTSSVRRINAIKASKLDAYRELAEQVYGQRIRGSQTIQDLVLQDDQLQASVDAVIRGAEIIKSYPVGEDTYATEVKLDMKKVHDMYISTSRPRRIKNVTYY